MSTLFPYTALFRSVARTYRSGHVSISPRFVRTDQVQYRSRVILYPVNSTLGHCGGMNSAILCHTQIWSQGSGGYYLYFLYSMYYLYCTTCTRCTSCTVLPVLAVLAVLYYLYCLYNTRSTSYYLYLYYPVLPTLWSQLLLVDHPSFWHVPWITAMSWEVFVCFSQHVPRITGNNRKIILPNFITTHRYDEFWIAKFSIQFVSGPGKISLSVQI